MAVSLSSMAAALRPGVLGGKKKKVAKKAEEAATALREWLPITPKGSWERVGELVRQAAMRAPEFGAWSDESPCWFISIWASYPDKNAVVVANSETGALFLARYAIDADENVTFPAVRNAEASVTVTEALKRVREMKRPGRRVITEGAKPARLTEQVKFDVRIREIEVDDKGARAVCIMLAEGAGNVVDGHYYLDECMESAAKVFEGAQSFADHADEMEERLRPGRSIRDLIGWWSDVHVEEADGKKLLVGTFNIESGNEFALNKMREAKKYAARYADQPEKQYVGFSISAGGVSESRQIDGKTYNAVLRITEAGSTDMVTRAGAGGKMLSLREEQRMGKPDTGALADSIAAKIIEGAKANNVTVSVTSKVVESAVQAAGLELDADEMAAFTEALVKAVKEKASAAADAEDEDAEADDIDDVIDALPAKKKKEAAMPVAPVAEGAKTADAAVIAENAKLLAENNKLKAASAFNALKETAKTIVRELKVPKAAQAYVLGELLECDDADAMRERGKALLEGVIRPLHGDGVAGLPARARESAATGVLNVSGIAE